MYCKLDGAKNVRQTKITKDNIKRKKFENLKPLRPLFFLKKRMKTILISQKKEKILTGNYSKAEHCQGNNVRDGHRCCYVVLPDNSDIGRECQGSLYTDRSIPSRSATPGSLELTASFLFPSRRVMMKYYSCTKANDYHKTY